jgi:hypothetical protein
MAACADIIVLLSVEHDAAVTAAKPMPKSMGRGIVPKAGEVIHVKSSYKNIACV